MPDDARSSLDLPAAIIIETVKTEGSVNVASIAWLNPPLEITERHGIVLVLDEIQVGCGRTGKFFSFEEAGILSDIVTLSTSLSGSGLPLALALISRTSASGRRARARSSTSPAAKHRTSAPERSTPAPVRPPRAAHQQGHAHAHGVCLQPTAHRPRAGTDQAADKSRHGTQAKSIKITATETLRRAAAQSSVKFMKMTFKVSLSCASCGSVKF